MSTIIDNIEPNEFALLVSLFALAITDGLSANESNSLGTFIAAVGSTIQSISAQQQLIETIGSKAGVDRPKQMAQ